MGLTQIVPVLNVQKELQGTRNMVMGMAKADHISTWKVIVPPWLTRSKGVGGEFIGTMKPCLVNNPLPKGIGKD